MTTLPFVPRGTWTNSHRSDRGVETDDSNAVDFIELVNAVEVPIMVIRSDFTVTCFNRAASDVLRLEPSDIGRPPSSIALLSALPDLEEWCAEVISGEAPVRHEFRAADKWFIIRAAPYKKQNGQITDVVLTLTNVTAFRASIDKAIYEREYTKMILNTIPDPLVVLGEDMRAQTANRAFYLTFRMSRETTQGLRIDELSDHAFNLPALMTQLKETLVEDRAFQPLEADCELPGIGLRTLMLNACRFSLPGQSGRLALLSFQDITERKRAEEHALMLAQEVDHRSKNLLSLVQATVRLTQADNASDLKKVIEGRIQALSNAHTLLAESRWSGADLRRLVAEELSPYCMEGASRADIHGPDLSLKPKSAQSVAMVLHELTTNAVKYGALSVQAGRIKVEWSYGPTGQLVLRWTETGGPPVEPPSRNGFGTRVMRHVIPSELEGTARQDWRAEGLVFEISFPANDG